MEKRTDISKLQKNRGIHLKIGMIIALSFCFWAFNYSVEVDDHQPDNDDIFWIDEEIETVPQTKQEEKRLPPPKVEVKQNIAEEVEELVEFIEEPEPQPQSEPIAKPIKTVKKVVLAPPKPKPIAPKPKPKVKKETPAPTPPVIEEEAEDKIFVAVEKMPLFHSKCSKSYDSTERKICSDQALLKYVNKRIDYPTIARENGIQGTVVINFIIDEKGNVTNPKIIKDIGGGCGEEALRVVRSMSKWVPGQQQNKKVKVQYNLPVSFKLK